MSKTVHRIMTEKPLVVYVTKNGRPVSEVVGASHVRRHFPHISNWAFSKNDHSFVAKEI